MTAVAAVGPARRPPTTSSVGRGQGERIDPATLDYVVVLKERASRRDSRPFCGCHGRDTPLNWRHGTGARIHSVSRDNSGQIAPVVCMRSGEETR
jgi:hypothetical protein